MRLTSLLLAPASALALVACGEPVDISFGGLEGNYTLNEGDIVCSGSASGSRFTADCITNVNGDVQGSIALTMTLGSDRFEAQLTWTDGGAEWDRDWCESTSLVRTASLVATRQSSRNSSGPLSAFGGVWYATFEAEDVAREFSSISGELFPSAEACRDAAQTRGTLERVQRYAGTATLDALGTLATGSVSFGDSTVVYYNDDGSVADSRTGGMGGTERFELVATDGTLQIGGTTIRRD